MKRASPSEESDDELLLSPKKRPRDDSAPPYAPTPPPPSKLPRYNAGSKRSQAKSKPQENANLFNAFEVLMGKAPPPDATKRKQIPMKHKMKKKSEKRTTAPKPKPAPLPLDEDSDGGELEPLGDRVLDSLRLTANGGAETLGESSRKGQLFDVPPPGSSQQAAVQDDTQEDPPVSSPVLEVSPPINSRRAVEEDSALNTLDQDTAKVPPNASSPLTEHSMLTPMQDEDAPLPVVQGETATSVDADVVTETPRSTASALSELTDLPVTPADTTVVLEDALVPPHLDTVEDSTEHTADVDVHAPTPPPAMVDVLPVDPPKEETSETSSMAEADPPAHSPKEDPLNDLPEAEAPPLSPPSPMKQDEIEAALEDVQPPESQTTGPSKPSSTSSSTSKPRITKRKPARPPPVSTRMTRSTSQRKKATPEAEARKPGGSNKTTPEVEFSKPGSSRKAIPNVEVAEPERGSSPLSSPPPSPTQGATSSKPKTNGQKRASAIPKAATAKGKGAAVSAKPQSLVGSSIEKDRAPSRPNSAPSSPVKVARSASMYEQPVDRPLYQPSDSQAYNALDSALSRLHEPPPPRPNTSMGFNRDDAQDDDEDRPKESKDDFGLGRPGHKRASTTGQMMSSSSSSRSSMLQSSSSSSLSSSSSTSSKSKTKGPTLAKKPGGIQTKLTFGIDSRLTMTNGLSRPSRGITNGQNGRGRMLPPPAFHRTKVSKNPSLPSVQASPQKGANGDNDVMIVDDLEVRPLPSLAASLKSASMREEDEDVVMGDPEQNTSSRNKGKGRDMGFASSPPNGAERRSNRLRSTSASQPNIGPSNGDSQGDESQAESSTVAKSKSFSPHTAPFVAASSSTVLKDCTVFVDVRTEDGDSAGDLFVSMLKDMGAKVLGTAGRTCTHIVFKDGLTSTVKNFRSFKENPPHMVGVGWVAQCAQEQAHADESAFLVDTSDINIAAGNKRRKSMIPKHFSFMQDEPDMAPGWADKSADSIHSIDDDEDLPPLERARRRKSFLPTRS